jgi:hypothetical protein
MMPLLRASNVSWWNYGKIPGDYEFDVPKKLIDLITPEFMEKW